MQQLPLIEVLMPIRVRKSLLLVLILSLSSILGFALTTAPAPQSGPVAREGYAGDQFCVGCHVLEGQAAGKTPHMAASASVTFGCEGCHGPGSAHVDAMDAAESDEDFEAAARLVFAFDGTPVENSGQCLTCHQTSRYPQHFDRSEHQLVGVACQNCHAPHLMSAADAPAAHTSLLAQRNFFSRTRSPDEESRWLDNSLLRMNQPDLCYTCHSTVKAQFELPVHHRVPEGLMQCTDCHNPHGTRNQPMLLKTNWETCVDCHAEKRGPYVFEHAAVEVEGCASCHAPHGSVNRNLLLRREGRFLCLQCHVDPHAPNVPHGRLSFPTRGECVRCHVAVHGSNRSPFLLD